MQTGNELVTFYPTYGYKVAENWHIPMRIWVREAATGIRKMLANQIRKIIRNKVELDQLTEQQIQFYSMRAENFVADNESFEKVEFQFDQDPEQQTFVLKDLDGGVRTDFNGLQIGTLVISDRRARQILHAQESNYGWLTLRAVSKDHVGSGQLRLIQPQGTSIISDIDDTIKVTDITAGSAVVLMNTFFKDFVAAPGMLEKYQAYGSDTAFHYVSGGPWQMYEPLAQFLFNDGVGFPDGSIHMKNVRLNLFESESYGDLWRLISKGSEATIDQKIRQIMRIMVHFPEREFVLFGDSGEHDPEIFAQIREQKPNQVKAIHIRDVKGDHAINPDRYLNMQVITTKDKAHWPNLVKTEKGEEG